MVFEVLILNASGNISNVREMNLNKPMGKESGCLL
jgi:hypothetical protein